MSHSTSSLAAIALLSLSLSSNAALADSSCGRVSVFDTAPRTQELFSAVLIAVDGRLPGPASSSSFRLSPGKHVLTVAEAIDSNRFSGVQQRARSQNSRDRYQTLEIEVRPGVTYRLASRFNQDQRNGISKNAYWSPVIWKETPEGCG